MTCLSGSTNPWAALRPSDSTIRGLCAEPKSAIRSTHGCSKVVRKSIARVNTVHNQKVKQALRVNYKDAKCALPCHATRTSYVLQTLASVHMGCQCDRHCNALAWRLLGGLGLIARSSARTPMEPFPAICVARGSAVQPPCATGTSLLTSG
jgi:hypothetical protein